MPEISAHQPPGIQTGESVILFDGICLLCLAWVKFIILHDRERVFKLASAQSPEGQALLEFFNYSTEQFDTLLVIQEGHCLDETEAILAVLKHLNKPWAFGTIFKFTPISLRNKLYRFIAQRRYQIFGKAPSCIMPTADHTSRFLGSKH